MAVIIESRLAIIHSINVHQQTEMKFFMPHYQLKFLFFSSSTSGSYKFLSFFHPQWRESFFFQRKKQMHEKCRHKLQITMNDDFFLGEHKREKNIYVCPSMSICYFFLASLSLSLLCSFGYCC